MTRPEEDRQDDPTSPDTEIVYTELPITPEDIRKRVEQMAKDIADKYNKEHKDKKFVLALVTKGALVFGADLGRALARQGIVNPRLVLIEASSYDGQDPQELEIRREFGRQEGDINVDGDYVLIADDVADTGQTQSVLKRKAQDAGAIVDVAVLCNKPLGRKVPFVPDFIGFNVKGWIYGYGMDTGEPGEGNEDNGRFYDGLALFPSTTEQTLTQGEAITPEAS